MAKHKQQSKFQQSHNSDKPQASGSSVSTANKVETIAQLRQDYILWFKLRVLVYDLRHLSTDNTSERRLSSTTDATYLISPYLSPAEATRVKRALVSEGETVEQALSQSLENFLDKRRASGDFRPCGAHDLAPIYLTCFGVARVRLKRKSLWGG